MGRDSGRTGKPGNKAGQPGSIKIAMKDPHAHLKLNKKKG